MQNESDALKIARWCWPESYARAAPGSVFAADETVRGEARLSFIEGVHAAERVLIERGLAEEYGRELIRVLFGEDEFGNPGLPLNPVSYATIATAPLDARVCAMAAVIRARSDRGS